jgi:PAS domain S-box-containing protein
VLESISDAFYAVNTEWNYFIFHGAAEQYFGVTRDQVLGRNMWEVFPQGIGTPFETVCKRAMEGRKGAAFESPSRWRPDRWVEIRITPMIDGGIGVSLHDITERRKAEQARELLAREVDHRSRNALAVVQAIVRLTEGPDLESYKEAVFGRVNALARAQGALADRRWEGAPLQELVDEAMTALATPDRYSLEGPAVRLSPEQTQPVSMLIHELATNASKYGGLSTAKGRVAIAWTLTEDGAIDLAWRESGGPAVSAPSKPGFGSRLMTQLSRQMAAKLSQSWESSGLVVHLAIPPPPNPQGMATG